MSIASLAREFIDQPYFLLDREKADPTFVFEYTFTVHDLLELKEFLWDALECCLTSNDAPFDAPEGRKKAILYAFTIRKCLEATKLTLDRHREKMAQPIPDDPAIKYKDIDSLTAYDLCVAHEYYIGRLNYFNTQVLNTSELIRKIIVRISEFNPVSTANNGPQK
jgi:hypothetical protein